MGWWVHAIPRFGGLTFTFLFLPDHLTTWGGGSMRPLVSTGCPSLLARPPHDVGWWVHATPRFDGLPLHLLFLTRPPHDVGWWVHAIPRFGGLPFAFILTSPPHDVWWRVHLTPRFGGLPFAVYSPQAASRRAVAGPFDPSLRRAAFHFFILTRPPHDVWWRVQGAPHFDGLPLF